MLFRNHLVNQKLQVIEQKRMKKIIVLGLFLLALFAPYSYRGQEVVYICTWYDLLPKEVIYQFEQETGIKVIYDVFDSNDILETKLLTGYSGYDVVTPSASPYFVRGVNLGVFEALDKSMLSNYKNIDQVVLEQFGVCDPDHKYGVPYGFGTFGLVYNKEITDRLGVSLCGYDGIFNPETAKKLRPYGIALGDEPFDILPSILGYLGMGDVNLDEVHLDKVFLILSKIRPYIKHFNSARHINDLLVQEIALALSSNHDAMKAIYSQSEVKLGFFIPESESQLWIDAFAIPKNAPNIRNAHTFINFMLREDIAAKITNVTFLPNSVSRASMSLVNSELRNDKNLFLERLEKYRVYVPQTVPLYRQVIKMWTRMRLGRG